MNKSTAKMILRSIRSSLGRFIAIFTISALGVGFLAGLLAATPDMVASGSRYFTENRMAHVRVISNVGLDEEDALALSKIEGVESVMAVKSADALFVTPKSTTIGVTVIGLDKNMLDRPVNKLTLLEGRLPEKAGECLVEETIEVVSHTEVGETLYWSPQNDEDLAEDLYAPSLTVVGVVSNPYFMAMSREATSVGNGKISDVVYVLEESFSTDYYTNIYLTLVGAGEELSLSEGYNALVDPIIDSIEDMAESQKHHRHDKVLSEARDKIDEAWETYYEKRAEADEEFAKAEDKISKAERDIADGKRTLAEKTKEAEDKIADGERELADALIELQDGEEEYKDGLAEYTQGQLDYNEGLREFEDGKKKYADGERELRDARSQLESAESQLDQGYAQLEAGKTQLAAAQQQLDAGATLAAQQIYAAAHIPGFDAITTANQLIAAVDATPGLEAQLGLMGMDMSTFRDGQAQIDAQAAVIAASQQQLDAGKAALDSGWSSYSSGASDLRKAKKELDEAEQKLKDAEKELLDGKQELEDARKELDDGWAEYYDGVKELEDGKKELYDEVAKAKRDIAKGEADLAQGKLDYEEAKAEADEKLDDAEYKIKDAESKLEDISEPKWYILGRDRMMTPASFDSNTEKVASIAKVFPVFFFLIAALVCLTTMTRMVEEERGVIGTMKALGYSSAVISSKYLIYAFLAAAAGSVIGLMVGFVLFPTVIWNAYSIMYRLPELSTPFNFKYAAFASLSTVACILSATWWVCRESLGESAASLMLPKAPQPGKRVLLEYVTPVWRRLTFNTKVTVRNLFRYKKRFFMTVIGVAGCTALLVTGFGLKDSISDILNNQFNILWDFNLMIGVKDDINETPLDRRLTAILNELEGHMAVHQESGKVSLGRSPESEVLLYVPEDADVFGRDYVLFRHRIGHESVPFGPGMAILTEKAASTIGAEAGDTITLRDADDKEYQVKISGIVENYIQGYVYMAPDLYSSVFEKEPGYNMLFCKSGDLSSQQRDDLAERILKCSSASSTSFTQDISDDFNDTFKSIDMIVWVLIICAGLLAFVVLYNLTNININERHKEIATLKVLGFFEPEVASYILKETNALSAIGALVGLGAGKILHGFVARTAEVDMVMFGRIVMAHSYFYALGLTMVFSLLVSLFMMGKLKAVSMVESLKAPE